jgi:hypothetical protein
MKCFYGLMLCCLAVLRVDGALCSIDSLSTNGRLRWTTAFTNGICTLESATTLRGPWLPQNNFFTSNSTAQISLTLTGKQQYFRLLSSDISSNAPNAWSNLISSYGVLKTLAGNGQLGVDVSNFWQSSFEGGRATNANLSRPHFAMADTNGNIFIVDKDSHSVLKVTADGNIHTVAGTHVEGYNGDGPAAGTALQLDFPNGLWVRGDGTVYILDTGNGRIRRLDSSGIMTTLVTVTNGIAGGRGLWVKDDESLIYYVDGNDVKKWTPTKLSTLNNKSFGDPGNLVVNGHGELIVTDRGNNKVYRLNKDGSKDVLAGDGSTNSIVNGTLAINNGLYGVRGVWYLPNDGYLLALHEGSQIAYVDPAGFIYVFLDGYTGDTHSGDGEWFHTPGYKIGEARSVTMDNHGNIIICENDNGYIRFIPFMRMSP